MKIQKSLFALLFFLSLLSFLPASAAAKDQWIRVRSKNFNLIGNADEKNIREAAAKLEQFREILRQILNQTNFDSPIPTTIVVFKTAADYKPYKPVKANGETENIVVGYFQPGRDVNYITLAADANGNGSYAVIFHEYTHFLIRNNLGESKIPPWYNEGIAGYYETLAVEGDRKITLGAAPDKFPLLLARNSLIPFDTFFDIDNYSLHEQGDDRVGLFYAQAWALTHYLMNGGGAARKSQLDKFLGFLLAGKSPKKAFAEAFEIDYATMEGELKKYIAQNSFPTTNVSLKNKLSFDAEMKSAPISDAEAEAYIGDLLLHSNRLAEAEAHLQNALKLNPALSMARASLGLVRLRQQDFAEAQKLLEKAAASDSANYLAHYYYAYALSREGMSEFGFVVEYNRFAADLIRKHLKKAIELAPDFAESYDLYAFVSVVRNEEIDEAIEYLNKALKIAPGNQWYLIRLSELYLRKEEFSAARSIAAKVARTAADKELKIYSQTTLGLINSTEAAYNEFKYYKNRQRKNDFLDRVLTDEEFAALRAQKLLELLNAALYQPKSGEKRVLGRLTEIDCEPEQMIYRVETADRVIKLRSQSFYAVKLTAYTSEMANWQIGCGGIKKPALAVINYRTTAAHAATENISGDIISIEFVPEDFKFLD